MRAERNPDRRRKLNSPALHNFLIVYKYTQSAMLRILARRKVTAVRAGHEWGTQ